jgi:hypothetical protein
MAAKAATATIPIVFRGGCVAARCPRAAAGDEGASLLWGRSMTEAERERLVQSNW